MRCAAALLMLVALTAFGEDTGWIASGSRSDNPLILYLLAESDFDEAAAVLKALSKRPDQYAEDIIETLFDQHSDRATRLLEGYLTRVTLGPSLEGWARANPRAVARLVSSLDTQNDADFKAAILRLFPYAERRTASPALARELASLRGPLARAEGHAAGGTRRELFAALDAAARVGSPEHAEPILRIAEIARDAEVVDLARAVAAALLGEEPPPEAGRGEGRPQEAAPRSARGLETPRLEPPMGVTAGRSPEGR